MNSTKEIFNKEDMHGYQNISVDHIIENPYCGLFLDMGLGKTVATLTAIDKLLFNLFDIDTVLVVAPKKVVESVWEQETKKWTHLDHLTISRVHGNPKQRNAALAAKANIYLISRDNIAWLIGLYGGSMLPFDMLVIDESSSFKNHKSVRFKALRGVQSSFCRIVILTGTPSPNGLIDIWSQIFILDGGHRLGKYITRFREEYFRPGQRNGAIVYNYNIQKDGEERIYKKIGDLCISMKAEDYLGLPGKLDVPVKINFPPDLQEKYDKFERDQIMKIIDGLEDGEEISAANAAALSTKLLQFANGAVYDEDKNYHVVHDLKLDAAEEIIENACGKPVLIGWTFRHDMYRLKERLKKYEPRELKTDQDIVDWNNGKIQVMLMHPASGGHGLNLQSGGNIIIWFGQTWSLELYQQLNARLNRQGQTKVTIIHHLIAAKTLDQKVIAAQKRKDATQKSLMNAIKARIKEYDICNN